ncbi:MAG: hypothetical protein JWM13_1238 [Arthrobacter sp.]|nr:hypothetical protein [Arthrobacter sp.]
MNPLDQAVTPVPARRRTKPVVWIAAALIILALIAGTVGSIAAHADSADARAATPTTEPEAAAPAATEPSQEQSTPKPSRTRKPTSDAPQKTYRFTSCNDVWAGGQGPFKKGEPGYTKQLDLDGDGIACESKPKD